MGAALTLAERMRGRTAPNPNVGCVIVRDGRVVGRGSTRPGGRPHAEAVALAQAGEQARGRPRMSRWNRARMCRRAGRPVRTCWCRAAWRGSSSP